MTEKGTEGSGTEHGLLMEAEKPAMTLARKCHVPIDTMNLRRDLNMNNEEPQFKA